LPGLERWRLDDGIDQFGAGRVEVYFADPGARGRAIRDLETLLSAWLGPPYSEGESPWASSRSHTSITAWRASPWSPSLRYPTTASIVGSTLRAEARLLTVQPRHHLVAQSLSAAASFGLTSTSSYRCCPRSCGFEPFASIAITGKDTTTKAMMPAFKSQPVLFRKVNNLRTHSQH
jgi:hypothetical protein